MLQKECREYLQALEAPLSSGMGLIFSNWDNRDGSEQFELDYGQDVSSSCESSQSKILNF